MGNFWELLLAWSSQFPPIFIGFQHAYVNTMFSYFLLYSNQSYSFFLTHSSVPFYILLLPSLQFYSNFISWNALEGVRPTHFPYEQ